LDHSDNKYDCISKAELAQKCGVCRGTIHLWLNVRFFEELKKLGYRKNQKILLPPQVKYLTEKLVIIEEI
jgi:hypothetical protein